MTKYKDRKPVVIQQSVEIQANIDHVVMILPAPGGTIGVRFVSPEHLLTTFEALMEAAIKVWPDNEWVREYQRKD